MSDRVAIRFKPDETDGAYVAYDHKNPDAPKYPALIMNESLTGVALVLTIDSKPTLGDVVVVTAGRLAPMKAKVVWLKSVPDEKIWKMGIQFLE